MPRFAQIAPLPASPGEVRLSFMPLPALFKCHYCGEEINTKSSSVMRLKTGWVSGPTGKVIQVQEQDHYKYCHEWCMPASRKADDTIPLF
mgnify:FL=1